MGKQKVVDRDSSTLHKGETFAKRKNIDVHLVMRKYWCHNSKRLDHSNIGDASIIAVFDTQEAASRCARLEFIGCMHKFLSKYWHKEIVHGHDWEELEKGQRLGTTEEDIEQTIALVAKYGGGRFPNDVDSGELTFEKDYVYDYGYDDEEEEYINVKWGWKVWIKTCTMNKDPCEGQYNRPGRDPPDDLDLTFKYTV